MVVFGVCLEFFLAFAEASSIVSFCGSRGIHPQELAL